MFLLIYVDDILIIGGNAAPVNELISKLNEKFALKDLGKLHYFLSVRGCL